MPLSSTDLLRLFLSELTRQNIPYVVLHSYEGLFRQIDSDVDYAVRTEDLSKLVSLQQTLAAKHGFCLAQALEAHIFSLNTVLISPTDPQVFIQLDACSHYAENSALLLPENLLLRDRRQSGDLFNPAPEVEFAYLLSKCLAKRTRLEEKMPRLRELHRLAPKETAAQFERPVGASHGPLNQWIDKPAAEWSELREPMLRRHRFSLKERWLEMKRAVSRVAQPKGLHIALIGGGADFNSKVCALVHARLVKALFRRGQIEPLARLSVARSLQQVLPAKVRNELIISFADSLESAHAQGTLTLGPLQTLDLIFERQSSEVASPGGETWRTARGYRKIAGALTIEHAADLIVRETIEFLADRGTRADS